ncbi:MAG TPA: hypothetical protein VFY90_11725 [Tepidiformaceae bacterium]|nr:hypothetical protein [Tepidiformaceae bacterium]
MEETQAVPSVTLKAAVSGRLVRLDQLEKPAVVMMFGQNNSAQVDPVVEAVRAKYPEEQVLLVSVADLSKLPKLLRKMAEGVMNGRYKGEAEKLRDGLDPAEHVVILPDWDGEVAPGFGLGPVDKQMAMAVVATGGRLAGTYQDAAPETAVTGMLESALA